MDAPAAPSPSPPSRLGWLVGLAAVALLMVLPVVVIGEEFEARASADASPIAMSATAAMGALFRASARSVFRGTVFTAARATTRAASRRFARRLVQGLGAYLLPDAGELGVPHRVERWALLVGGAITAASCAAVVWLRGPPLGVPLAGLAALSVLPMLVHFGVIRLLARALGARVVYAASADGLLLQAYFSAAGSFLPLCADAHLEGPPEVRARVAGLTLGVIWGLALALGAVNVALNGPWITAMMSFFLIYAFVFSFPLAPLQGSDVFERSKAGWAALFLGGLCAFGWLLPEAWYGIL